MVIHDAEPWGGLGDTYTKPVVIHDAEPWGGLGDTCTKAVVIHDAEPWGGLGDTCTKAVVIHDAEPWGGLGEVKQVIYNKIQVQKCYQFSDLVKIGLHPTRYMVAHC